MGNRLILESRMVLAAIIACDAVADMFKDNKTHAGQLTYEAMIQTAAEIRRQAPTVKVSE